MKTQLTFSEKEAKFKKMKININSSNISDVIIVWNTNFSKTYQNLMTRKEGSHLNEVIRDRRFVVIHQDEFGVNGLHGYYVFSDEKLDIIGLVLAEMRVARTERTRWEEKARYFLSNSSKSYGGQLFMESDHFDMCGQTIVADASIDNARYDICNVGAKKVIFSYLKGPLTYVNDFGDEYVSHFTSKGNIEGLFNWCSSEGSNSLYGSQCGVSPKIRAVISQTKEKDIIFLSKEELPPISEDAMKKIKYTARHLIKESELYRNGQYPRDEKSYDLAYLQKDGKRILVRLFHPVVYFDYPFEKTEVDVAEYKCYEISKNFKGTTRMDDLVCIPVLCDDLTETPFEYSSEIIHDAIEMLNKNISKNMGKNHIEGPEWGYSFSETKEEFDEKYGINLINAVFAAMCTAFNPTFERLCNIDYMKKLIMTNVVRNAYHLDQVNFWLEETLGSMDFSEYKIHKIVEVPRCALEIAMDNETIPIYKKIARFKAAKLMFKDSKKSQKYFLRMSKNDYAFLMAWMETVGVSRALDPMTESARKLMILYSYENWKNYLMFLETIFCSGSSQMYSEYIDRLYEVWRKSPDTVEAAEWRLSGETLEKSYNTIEMAYYALLDKNNEELTKAYKALIPSWERYVYECGDYMITYPTGPSSLLREGINLHHCAKDFIRAVSNGRTTILFIRKKEAPEKPFYTLEIKNDKIRQCHGFDNCNVKEGSDLEEFLKNFCKDKNITFDRGDNQLAI